jgi:hypothetical protein
MPASLKLILKHKAVLIALGAVGVIAAGSLAYFLIETHVPGFSYVQVTKAPIHQDIIATGSQFRIRTLPSWQAGALRM